MIGFLNRLISCNSNVPFSTMPNMALPLEAPRSIAKKDVDLFPIGLK
jgi:hypothetical protein